MTQVVRCPLCTGVVQIPTDLLGSAVVCPRCQGRFTAPEEFSTAAATVPPPLPTRPADEIPPAERKYCTDCGAAIRRKAVVCPKCGVPQASPTPTTPPPTPGANSNRVAAGIFGILLGSLGVHKFILGYTTEGIIMLLVTILGSTCFGMGFLVMWVVGIVEGVTYLTKSDAEFHATYEVGRRGWF